MQLVAYLEIDAFTAHRTAVGITVDFGEGMAWAGTGDVEDLSDSTWLAKENGLLEGCC